MISRKRCQGEAGLRAITFAYWRVGCLVAARVRASKAVWLQQWLAAVRASHAGRKRLQLFWRACQQSSAASAKRAWDAVALMLSCWRIAASESAQSRYRGAQAVEVVRMKRLRLAFRSFRSSAVERQRGQLAAVLAERLNRAVLGRMSSSLLWWRSRRAEIKFKDVQRSNLLLRAWASWSWRCVLRRRFACAICKLEQLPAFHALLLLSEAALRLSQAESRGILRFASKRQGSVLLSWRRVARCAKMGRAAAALQAWQEAVVAQRARGWLHRWKCQALLFRLRTRTTCRAPFWLWRQETDALRNLRHRLSLAGSFATWKLGRRAFYSWLLAGSSGDESWVPCATLSVAGVRSPNGGRVDKLSLWAAVWRVSVG